MANREADPQRAKVMHFNHPMGLNPLRHMLSASRSNKEIGEANMEAIGAYQRFLAADRRYWIGVTLKVKVARWFW